MSAAAPIPTAIWIVRESARPLADALARSLGAVVFPQVSPQPAPTLGATPAVPSAAPPASSPTGRESNREQFRSRFLSAREWVLVMASGIATRYLSGLPESKHSDPAVVVVDEACRFAIPILSGHEGGGNALAYKVSASTGATPVITTATEALKPLTIGIGCRRGMSAGRIGAAVNASLAAVGASLEQVREIATVDLKASEPGLLQWLSEHSLPLRVFSSQQLAERPLTAVPSEWVRRNVGLAGVCEPCALLASPRGLLILPKTPHAGVTTAIVSDCPDQLPFLSCPAN